MNMIGKTTNFTIIVFLTYAHAFTDDICGNVCLLEDGRYLGAVVLDSPGKPAHRVDQN